MYPSMNLIVKFLSFLSLLKVSIVVQSSSLRSKCLSGPNPNFRSQHGGNEVKIEFHNKSPGRLMVFWVDLNGQDSPDWGPELINPGNIADLTSRINHSFRIYDEKMGLIKEHQVDKEHDVVTIKHVCHDIKKASKEALEKEFRPLVHNQQSPCLPADDSSRWSCIHHISKEEYQERLSTLGGIKYGFSDTVESQTRDIGETEDHEWSFNIPLIPRVAKGPGFLKMTFTDRMKELLLDWYEEHKRGGPKDSVEEHRVIPGGFTNSHTVPMSKLNLPFNIHQELSNEMKRVLTWWTNQTLVETATFGIRIYHRESMLINHVDRADTHVASAVIQVAQYGVDEGWPLEVLHPDDSCSEVYLQPGEMVLYEGARFRHGRPMRFNGTDFANIFTHFRPIDWHGPGRSVKYDGKLDSDGYLITNEDDDEEKDEF